MQTDWNQIKSFLAIAEAGSLSNAAELLGCSQPTLGRHIDALEQALGVVLFVRSRKGMQLTSAGMSLLEDARKMQLTANKIALKAAGRSTSVSGTVRITASEIVSCFLLPPILARLKDAEPGIEIELAVSDSLEDLSARDADIAIRMLRPVQKNLIARKVNEMALSAFAHEDYLQNFSMPFDIQQPNDHRVIGYDRSTLILQTMAKLGLNANRSWFCFRTDNNIASWELVKSGAGIGFAPKFMGRKITTLKEVDLGVAIPPLPLWLASHAELRTSAKIRRTMDILASELKLLDLS